MAKNKVKVKEGSYEANLVSIKPGKEPTQVILTFEIIPPGETHNKFYIYHNQCKVFTTLAAKNIHHASNKAAKLYGDNWDTISKVCSNNPVWKYVGIVKFRELTKPML